jgi:hypothetical protein
MDTLSDLTYLALEAALWPYALRQETGKELLGTTYAYHATHLYAQERYQEAGEVAERFLETLFPHRRLDNITQCLVYKARSVALAPGAYALNRGIAVLQEGRRYPLLPDQQAWLWMQTAYYYQLQSRYEEMLEVMARSNRLPHNERPTCGETYEARICTASFLLNAGYSARAWEAVPTEIHPDPYQRVRVSLLASAVLLTLEKTSEAHDWLLGAQQEIERYDLAFFRTQASRLAQKF